MRAATIHPLLILSILGLAASSTFGQVASAQRTVTTTGTASVFVTPDQAELRFGITTFDTDLTKAKQQNDETAAKTMAFLKQTGIAESEIQTSRVTSDAVYDERYEDGRSVRTFKGYTVYRGYNLKLNDLTKFTAVTDRLLTDTSIRMEAHFFKSSENRRYRDQARREAAIASREKAELLAGALDARVGAVRTITEEQPPTLYPMALTANRVQMDAGGASESASPVGQIEIRAEVTATFDIEPVR